jgi:hypothetical protein
MSRRATRPGPPRHDRHRLEVIAAAGNDFQMTIEPLD